MVFVIRPEVLAEETETTQMKCDMYGCEADATAEVKLERRCGHGEGMATVCQAHLKPGPAPNSSECSTCDAVSRIEMVVTA